MALNELYYIVQKRNRKTGELSYFRTKADFTAAVVADYELIHMEPTDKVLGFSGQMMDAPDGSYSIRGPSHKNYTWDVVLTVAQRTSNAFSVV